MSQMTAPGERATDDAGIKEQAQELVQQKAQQARGALAGVLGGQVDERSTQLGSQLQDVTTAFRRTSESLRAEGKEAPAKVVESLTERTERIGSYLSEARADDLLQDAEHFGRRNPWVVIAGGVALGLVASRLLKASSTRRFEELHARGYSSHRPRSQWGAAEARPSLGAGTTSRVAAGSGTSSADENGSEVGP